MKFNLTRLSLFILFVFATLALSACVTLKDPESAQDGRADIVAVIQAGQPVGQTFQSRRSQLNSIQLYLSIAERGDDTHPAVKAELFHQPGDSVALVSEFVSFSSIETQFPVVISFPPLDDPAGQSYTLQLSTQSGSVRAYGSQYDNYAHGEMLSDGLPQAGDLSFQLGYAYNLVAMAQDLFGWLRQAWLLLPLLLVLWLPGNFLLTALLGREHKFAQLDVWQRFALSLGLSLASLPLFLLWTTTLGIRLNRTWVFVLFGFLLALKVWQLRQIVQDRIRTGWKAPIQFNWDAFALLLIFLFSLGIRLAMTRDLAAPAWVDSVHHATLVRLILEQGAYPDSYQPLIPAATASYHAGYHAVMACYTWLAGLELQQGMLIFGQVLNALSVVAAYLFTLSLTTNRKAAVLAGLICGVFTPMPAYLASWGRYTHLTAMLILPAAYTFLVHFFPVHDPTESELDTPNLLNEKARWLLLAAICAAGLFLVHYQVLAFLVCLLLAQVGVWLGRNLWRKAPRREILSRLGWLLAAGLCAILLSLPWWPPALETLIVPRAAYNPTAAPFAGFTWGYLTSASGKPVLIIAGLGLIAAVLQLRWFATITYLWVGLLFLLANLGALGLPFSSFVNHISVEMTLFMPLSALSGYALAEGARLGNCLMQRFTTRAIWRWLPALGWMIAIPLSLLGAQKLLPILNPVTLLARQADLPAIHWIEKHVPTEATVLINPFAWGYGLYAGNDGGFWITPLAGRKTIPPPILYGLGKNRKVVTELTEFTRQAIDLSKDPVGLHALMQAQQVDYLYCGVRGGVFNPALFTSSPLFETVYNQDGVWVFKRR